MAKKFGLKAAKKSNFSKQIRLCKKSNINLYIIMNPVYFSSSPFDPKPNVDHVASSSLETNPHSEEQILLFLQKILKDYGQPMSIERLGKTLRFQPQYGQISIFISEKYKGLLDLLRKFSSIFRVSDVHPKCMISLNTTPCQPDPIPLSKAILHIMEYKTNLCNFKQNNKCYGELCFHAHGIKELRRDPLSPFFVSYLPVLCPNIQEDEGYCPHGKSCTCCSNEMELLHHPEQYRSSFCETKGTSVNCKRYRICAFAHTSRQLRLPISDEVKKTSAAYFARYQNWEEVKKRIDLMPFDSKESTFTDVYLCSKETALHYAAKYCNIEVITTLLKKWPDLDVNQRDLFGQTALHKTAAYAGGRLKSAWEETVETLIKHKADPCIKDDKGHDAYYFAKKNTARMDLRDGLVSKMKEYAKKYLQHEKTTIDNAYHTSIADAEEEPSETTEDTSSEIKPSGSPSSADFEVCKEKIQWLWRESLEPFKQPTPLAVLLADRKAISSTLSTYLPASSMPPGYIPYPEHITLGLERAYQAKLKTEEINKLLIADHQDSQELWTVDLNRMIQTCPGKRDRELSRHVSKHTMYIKGRPLNVEKSELVEFKMMTRQPTIEEIASPDLVKDVVALLNTIKSEEIGKIYYGLDTEGKVIGIVLNRRERNLLQSAIWERLKDIDPAITYKEFDIRFIPICSEKDLNLSIEDLFVIEIHVKLAIHPVYYGERQAWIKKKKGLRELQGKEITNLCLTRFKSQAISLHPDRIVVGIKGNVKPLKDLSVEEHTQLKMSYEKNLKMIKNSFEKKQQTILAEKKKQIATLKEALSKHNENQQVSNREVRMHSES